MAEHELEMNTGEKIPILGFGTWDLEGRAEEPIRWALEAGYRHIDTAKIYGTEPDIGRAVEKSSIPREEIFITTKVWNSDQGYLSTIRAFDQSLERLGMDYVDLYLVHWPAHDASMREDTWKAMEEIHTAGKVRAIGVSNYEREHLVEMETYANIPPAANQIEMHPYWFRQDLMDYCHESGVVVINYAPLIRKHHFSDPVLVGIAKKHGKSVPQVLLRWGVQHGNAVIPKSGNKAHIEENAEIFDFALDTEDMAQLDALNRNESVV